MRVCVAAPRAGLWLCVWMIGCGGGGANLPTEPGGEVPGGGGGNAGLPQPGSGGGGASGGGAPPAHVSVAVGDDDGFRPDSVRVATGGTVTWMVVDGRHDVTFLGPAPSGGSIPETREGESVARSFGEAGRYQYECARHRDEGERGVVIVAQGDASSPPVSGRTVVRTPGERFDPPSITVAAGDTIHWEISGARHNVTFTGAAPPGGDIPDTEGGSVARVFAAPGRYDYVCTRHAGMSGTVVVE